MVTLTLIDRGLSVALVEDSGAAKAGLRLPSIELGVDDDLDGRPHRLLNDLLSVDTTVRQFYTFGQPDRVLGKRIVAVGYAALFPQSIICPAVGAGVRLLALYADRPVGDDGSVVSLAFDHSAIIAAAVTDLRNNLDQTDFAFGLLPSEFTLRELQEVHEAIRSRRVNKPAFRKRMLDSGKLEPTGRRENDQRFRPAELYRLRPA